MHRSIPSAVKVPATKHTERKVSNSRGPTTGTRKPGNRKRIAVDSNAPQIRNRNLGAPILVTRAVIRFGVLALPPRVSIEGPKLRRREIDLNQHAMACRTTRHRVIIFARLKRSETAALPATASRAIAGKYSQCPSRNMTGIREGHHTDFCSRYSQTGVWRILENGGRVLRFRVLMWRGR